MSKPTGGNAFPVPGFREEYQDGSTAHEHPKDGMTLRDWFAGQALTGLVADPQITGKREDFARYAYEYADAMIAGRDKP